MTIIIEGWYARLWLWWNRRRVEEAWKIYATQYERQPATAAIIGQLMEQFQCPK